MTFQPTGHVDLLRFGGRLDTRYQDAALDARTQKTGTVQPTLFDKLDRFVINAPVRFAIIGDPGSGSKAQHDIARQLWESHQRHKIDFVLVLGDNIYPSGEPELFEERLYAPYKALFEDGVKFLPVMGNHDARKGFEADQRKFWGAPDFYNFRIGPTEFFAIDTTLYLPGYDGCYKHTPSLAKKRAEVQTRWLEAALAKSTAKIKLVYGHYPMYSSGNHGFLEQYLLKFREQLEPLLTKYGVNVYLAGHEHHYERSRPQQGITHIVSGAAGMLRPLVMPQQWSKTADKLISSYHFMTMDVRPEGRLTFEAIDRQGRVIDAGEIPPKAEPSAAKTLQPEASHYAASTLPFLRKSRMEAVQKV
jgi:3',5'-cyclic AMP phosphodiesterase CpdA